MANADTEITVSPCPYCRTIVPTGAPACDQCRLSYSEHIRYTEVALAHYETHASSYERLASLFALVAFYPVQRYRSKAIELLELKEGDAVLDMGCGTGLSFDAIEERIGPSGRLIGLDYTEAMLAEAAKRAEERGWQNIEFVQGDAANVAELVATPVDAVVSAFCLSLVPGWQQAIAGIAGLLSEGGRFVVLDWRTMKARGPMRVLSPVLEWLTKRYGLADPSVNFSGERPWRAVMEKHLAEVSYRETHFGTTFICTATKD